MNLAALFDRLDDRINPIVVKELRQAVKSRVVIILLLVFLALQLTILGYSILYSQASSFGGDSDWSAGRGVFEWIQGVLALTLILMVPAYACVRLAAERSDQNVDLLFISTLKPYSIVAGKFFAAFVLGLLVFGCCAPFMTFAYLLRGLDMPTILFVLLIDLLALLFATMLSMLLAAVPGGLVAKVAAIFMGYVVLIPSSITLIRGTVEVVEFGGPDWYSSDFWVISGSFMGAVVVLVGLFFWYTVALVSPPSSNRVLPIRAFVLAIWLGSVAGLYLLSSRVSNIAWLASLIVWVMVTSIILGLQFMISVSERDQYGPRLQRQIPSNLLLRIPAFYLYTGSANGIVFTLSLMLLTMVIGGWCIDRAGAAVATGHGPAGSEGLAFFVVALVMLLYLYNYGMTAVLLRGYLLGGHLRSGFTWLIHMLLIGVGSSLPAIVAFVFFSDQVGAGADAIWWKLPSPFLAAYNSIHDGPHLSVNEDFVTVCLWFLGIWWVLVTLLSVPWMVRQVLSFRPRTRPQPAAAPAEPAAAAAPVPVAELAPPEGVMADPPATSVQTG